MADRADAALPVMDLALARAGSRAERQQFSRQLDAVCREHGFFYLRGHGVAPALRSAAVAASKAFFALPEEDKLRWHIDRSGIKRGFDPVGWQSLDPGQPADLKESFYLGVERGEDDPLVRAGTPQQGPNQWPDEALVPGFRDAAEAYARELQALARELMGWFALALRLPQHYFEHFIQNPMPVLRLLHYPGRGQPALPGQLGCGAHTDWGALTLLAQDETGGLQVRMPDGRWQDVPFVDDSFVVNLGDMMARWTNDTWRSTPHRVLAPSGARERYSMAYFFDVDYHAEVRALPGCFDAANPPRYAPITAGRHIVEMYQRTLVAPAASPRLP